VSRRLKQIGSGILFIIAFCVAREMEVFKLDLPFKVTPSFTSKGTSPPSSGPPGDFTCRVVVKENVVTTAMSDAIKCSRSAKRDLVVTVDGDLAPPFCFIPFYKTGSIAFHVTIKEGDKTHVDSELTVGLKATGMVACRSFRKMLGREAGKAVDRLVHSIP